MLPALFAALRRGARRAGRPAPRFAPRLTALEGREVPAVLSPFGGNALTGFGGYEGQAGADTAAIAGKVRFQDFHFTSSVSAPSHSLWVG